MVAGEVLEVFRGDQRPACRHDGHRRKRQNLEPTAAGEAPRRRSERDHSGAAAVRSAGDVNELEGTMNRN